MKLYTVGYEGADIDEFVHFLKKQKITMVADVRKNPLSRKKGFSKNKLAENLRKKKIDYVHISALGVPSAWRKNAKAGYMTRTKMFSDYVQKILSRSHTEIEALLSLGAKNKLALLCFEADANDCHRHFVAEKMRKDSKRKVSVVDLEMP